MRKKICSNAFKTHTGNVCVYGRNPQPLDQFKSIKHPEVETALCLDCRKRANEQKRRMKLNIKPDEGQGRGIRARPVDELKKGDEPKYGGEGHKRMFSKWLRELINGNC